MKRENLVLCYHALSPTWEAGLSTTPERFERQLAILSELGYRGVTFSEAAAAPARSSLVAITFDDAFRSVHAFARPILERAGMPATVFVPTDYIDTDRALCWWGIEHWLESDDAHEMQPMSWAELRSLGESGWEVGSHTCSHPLLTRLDDGLLEQQLRVSRSIVEERLNRPCPTIAYPYGDVDARVQSAAADAGYGLGAALPARITTPDPLCWPRVGIYHPDDDVRFRMKISSVIGALRRSAAWTVLSAARTRARRTHDDAPAVEYRPF